MLVAVKYMYLEKDKTDNLLEVQDSKEKAKDVTTNTDIKITCTDQKNKVFIDNTTSTSKSKTVRAPRKRYATFSVGDNLSISDMSEDSSETFQLQPECENNMSKKRSLSFIQLPKWKKSHSIPDILKTPARASVTVAASPSVKEEACSVPTVTVTKHESFTEKKVHNPTRLTSLYEGRTASMESIRSVQECKQIMKKSVSNSFFHFKTFLVFFSSA